MFRRLLTYGLSAAECSSATAHARHRPFITPRARYHQTKRLSQRGTESSSTSTSIPSFKKRPKRIMELSPETRDELNAEVGYEKYGLTLSEDDVFCPTENPQTAKWDLALSDKDVVRILEGYDPERMEDRWALRADGPDELGNVVFHAYRSWTGHEIRRLQVKAPRFCTSGTPSTAEAKVECEGENQDARVTEITWEATAPNTYRPYTGNGAKEQAFDFCKYWLGCELK